MSLKLWGSDVPDFQFVGEEYVLDFCWSGAVGGGQTVGISATLSQSTVEATSPISVRSDHVIWIKFLDFNMRDVPSSGKLTRLNAQLRVTESTRGSEIAAASMMDASPNQLLFPAGRVCGAGPFAPIYAQFEYLGFTNPLIGGPLVLESNTVVNNSDGAGTHAYVTQATWLIDFYKRVSVR